MRVITYARYSSDLQRDASIEDQQRSCRAFAAVREWVIVGELADKAMSGSTMFRPGVQALLRAVKEGRCDVILCEGIDRLSRDLADTAALFKQLRYARVTLHTILEGAVNSMHVGLKGTMNEMYLAELAVRTHRGQEGRVLAGKIAGGNSYGYRLVPGQLGDREIDEAQARIVRRIFAEYSENRSPKSIARALNREGVAGPRAKDWASSTIYGQAARGTGILNNELYIGRLVWDRLKWVTHPDTGRRLPRVKPRETWKVVAVPQLRIVSDDLWGAAKARQEAIRHLQPHGVAPGQRPKHLFSGLTKCALCGASFSVVTKALLMCFNTREKGTCSNRRRIQRLDLEARVIHAMQTQLLAPRPLRAFCESYAETIDQWFREQRAGASGQKQELATVDRRIREIVAAVADGFRSEALRLELAALEAKRPALVAQAPATLPMLTRAQLEALFRKQVETISGDSVGQGIRRFVERIVVPPDGQLRVRVNLHLQDALSGCGGLQLPIASIELRAA